MAAIVKAFLKAGYGGILTTVKPTDRAMYERYLRETGRLDDLMVFGPTEPLRYNPLDAEVKRKDAGAGLTENVVSLLSTLLEVRERNSGSNEGEDSGYWKRANRQLMKNCVDLLSMAKGGLDVPSLYRLAVSAPVSRDQLSSDEWKNSSFCFQCLREADGKPKTRIQQADFELVADFFAFEWANLSERTRSVVLSTFTSMLDVLNRGIVRELLSAPESNVTPEMCQDGKVILLDLPIKVFGEVGLFVQVLWKYCLQKAQERRDVSRNPRPVFLVVDESHLLTTSSDQLFQTTARSTRTAVVNATQSVSNFLAVLGDKAEPEVNSLMGNLNTKIFHQQSDVKTNAYAAELIGKTRQYLINANSSRPSSDLVSSMFGLEPAQYTAGVNETYEWEVQPTVFGTLRKGGPPDFVADTIVYQGGRRFEATGKPWMPVVFQQHL
tara:strand:- start:104918 stop:106231 length:1314 start_codon:yes stop_codon:yes gene_type:complete